MFKLYDYFRSSASFRVRIALNLKKIDYEQVGVHLLKDGGQQFSDSYKAINPQTLVPSLVLNAQDTLTQSLAIIEYLEEKYPTPPFLPQDLLHRAKVRALSQIIACDIHPINNLRVLKYLKHELHVTDEQKSKWYRHWVIEGFNTIERFLDLNNMGPYCYGESITIADICLIPQIYNAERFDVSMADYPRMQQINKHCLELEAFNKALPENQPDAD